MKTAIIGVLAALFVQAVAHAQTTVEETIKQLVQQEVERLLQSEELDATIEEAIRRIVAKQRAQAELDREAQQQAMAANMRPVDAARDHIAGNHEAPITLVEYSDFECPFCKRFHPTVIDLVAANPDKVRWVYRHFPLSFHNPGAQRQAEASECIAELAGNDAFWEFTHAIYDRTESGGTGFPLAHLQPLAEEVGVDGDAFAECMDSGRMIARVNEDFEEGSALGINGTPGGFMLNRDGEARVVVGAMPLDDLQRLVDELE